MQGLTYRKLLIVAEIENSHIDSVKVIVKEIWSKCARSIEFELKKAKVLNIDMHFMEIEL